MRAAFAAAAILCLAHSGAAQTVVPPPDPGAAKAAPAEDASGASPAVTWSASAVFVSAYVWRGFIVADTPSFQPTASVSAYGLTVTTWFNVIAATDDAGWSEHDLVIDYTKPVGTWKLSVGYTNYYFPTVTEGSVSNEFYGGVAWSGLLNPTVKVYQDVSEGSGTYVSAGVSQAFPLGSSKVTVTPAMVIGYNHHQWVSGSGWSDLNLGLTVSVPVNKHVDLSASFNYSKSFQPDWFPSHGYSGITIAVH